MNAELKLKGWFERNYLKTLVIPVILFVVATLVFFNTMTVTGDWINKDIEFMGGSAGTLVWNAKDGIPNVDLIDKQVTEAVGAPVTARTLNEYTGGQVTAIVFEAGVGVSAEKLRSAVNDTVFTLYNISTSTDMYSERTFGPSISDSILKTAYNSVFIAFVLMALVVFIIFRDVTVAGLMVLCAVLNVYESFALMNLLGLRLSLGTLTAVLGVIAYSVDDNMLIATKLTKQSGRKLIDLAWEGMRTGATITGALMIALLALRLVSNVDIMVDIATLLFFSKIVDISNTWFQNIPMMMRHVERKNKAKTASA